MSPTKGKKGKELYFYYVFDSVDKKIFLYNYNEFTHNNSQYFMHTKMFFIILFFNDSFINIYLLITIFYAYLLYINKTL